MFGFWFDNLNGLNVALDGNKKRKLWIVLLDLVLGGRLAIFQRLKESASTDDDGGLLSAC